MKQGSAQAEYRVPGIKDKRVISGRGIRMCKERRHEKARERPMVLVVLFFIPLAVHSSLLHMVNFIWNWSYFYPMTALKVGMPRTQHSLTK